MNENLQINTRVRRLFHYIDDFQRGIIRVPAFQRDFVWQMRAKLELLDSIKRGYPIGSILFWRPDTDSDDDFLKFESNKIGSYFIPQRSSDYFYILDGYQRISTLFGCLVNPDTTSLVRDNEEWEREFNLIYNLEEDRFEYQRTGQNSILHKVPLHKFVDSKEFFGFQRELASSDLPNWVINGYLKKYENLSSRLIDYVIPSIDIIGGSIAEAVDIFSRVNSTGAKITDDWKVSALSFDQGRQFRLGSEIDGLMEELKKYNFQNIKRKLVLQCIINSFGDVFFDQSKPNRIEELAKSDDFVDKARATFENIKRAVRFLHDDILVVDYKLLPYGNQLVYITDFFNLVKDPSPEQLTGLRKWFWITSYSSYFTIYNLAKQRLAYRKFIDFAYGMTSDPVYVDKPMQKFSVLPFPRKIDMGSVRSKSLVLFLLNYQAIGKFVTSGMQDYMISPVFKDLRGVEIDRGAPENIFVQYLNKTEKEHFDSRRELSWFRYIEDDHQHLFISKEMKADFLRSQDVESFLLQRKRIIIEAENAFIELFGLKTDEGQ